MKKEAMPVWEAVFLVVAGLFLGTVFTFGMQFWNAEAAPEDCIQVETHLQSIQEIRRSGRVQELALECADGQRYFVDGVSLTEDLIQELSQVDLQEPVSMRVHPNSSTIVAFTAGDRVLLEFDSTMEKLKSEARGFGFLGIGMYLGALYGAANLLRHRRRR